MRKRFEGNTIALKDVGKVEGIYEGSKEVRLEGGDTCLVHTFLPREGGIPIEVWGFGQLDYALAKLKGCYVWAEYTGLQRRKTKFGEREVHTVEIEYDDEFAALAPRGPETFEAAS